jgi:predicted restriction endonuclease
VYCRKLEYLEHDKNTIKPVHIAYQSLDYDETAENQQLREIYNWKPGTINKTTSNNTYLVTNPLSKQRGEQKKPNYKERSGLVTSRVGQWWYRQEILKKWGNKCALTDCRVIEVLISSHIKGWSESKEDERLDLDNAILLTQNVDSLFDKHLISFEDDGQILISDKISKSDIEAIGLRNSFRLKVDNALRKYLSPHRIKFNEKQQLGS